MKRAIDTREVVTLTSEGVCLRGTYHSTRDDLCGAGKVLDGGSRIGLLFLNSGYLPRTGNGDSSVYWADSYAKDGYPSFRLDLPGLGDSDGVIPADMLEFVNRGGYSPVLSATLKELVERFSLSGVIIVGLCAGAVSALYAAAISRQCRGLVLLDPYFHLPQGRTKLREELSAWAARSALGTLMSNILDRLKHLGTLLRGNRLPKNANLPLLRCVAQLASAGMPVLMMKAPAVKAPGLKPRAGQFDYLSYVQKLSCRRSRIVVEFIEGTNHSFADAIGRVKVRRHTERWLNAHFPKTKREQAALKTLGQEEDNDNDDKNQESCSYR